MEKVIPEFPDYLVTDSGKVISMKFGKRRVMSPSISQSGYKRVVLSNAGKTRTIEIQRLVALAFIRRPKNKEAFYVNHINGKKTDNRRVNLEWVTPKGNSHHYNKKLRGRGGLGIQAKKSVKPNTNTLELIKVIHEKCDDPKMFQNLVGTILNG